MFGDGQNYDGLNAGRVSDQIKEFAEIGKQAHTLLKESITDFFNNLSTKWASPNAVLFSDEYRKSLSQLYYTLGITMKHKIHGANDAADIIAKANGIKWGGIPNPFEDIIELPLLLGKPLLEEINGDSGMARENVRIIKEALITNLKKVCDTLDTIPEKINFYSVGGSLLNSYSTGISNLKTEIKTTSEKISQAIDTYIETEVDNIKLAAIQANDILNANKDIA